MATKNTYTVRFQYENGGSFTSNTRSLTIGLARKLAHARINEQTWQIVAIGTTDNIVLYNRYQGGWQGEK
jgi:hypothetical protein